VNTYLSIFYPPSLPSFSASGAVGSVLFDAFDHCINLLSRLVIIPPVIEKMGRKEIAVRIGSAAIAYRYQAAAFYECLDRAPKAPRHGSF
jgi:hypothetical protein